MKPSCLGALALFTGAATAGIYPPDAVDDLSVKGMENLKKYVANNPIPGNCTLENAVHRKEWGDLSIDQRKDYVRAVLCLQALPAKTTAWAPGAKSRFDDFIVVHVQMTRQVHASTSFFAWHRYYIIKYEQALRDECGYKGYQPYWNWGRYADDPINSPLFNGNDSSLGGNGAYHKYSGIALDGDYGGAHAIPAAVGGGCVTTGPFANMTVNLGPLGTFLDYIKPNPQADGLGHNPRCLRRDINRVAASETTSDKVAALITGTSDMYWFDTTLEGEHAHQYLGLHVGGHYTVGGDPGGDFFMSPGDPAFWLHHAGIDRVWWVWQNQDPARRLYAKDYAYSRTVTMSNQPPSRNGTLQDIYGMGVLGMAMPQFEMMTTLGGMEGQACYVYD